MGDDAKEVGWAQIMEVFCVYAKFYLVVLLELMCVLIF